MWVRSFGFGIFCDCFIDDAVFMHFFAVGEFEIEEN
jgi:hypothetical protein